MEVGTPSQIPISLVRRQRRLFLEVFGLEIRLNSWEILFGPGHGKAKNFKLTTFLVLTGTALF